MADRRRRKVTMAGVAAAGLGALAAAAPGWAAAGAAGQTVAVAVAANFAAPMQRLARDFERRSADGGDGGNGGGGHRVALSFGATGALYAQIRHGAPFDVLLAADQAVPARLEAEGLAVAGTRFTYAVGRLALWSAQPGRVDAEGRVLHAVDWRRLALADPRLAPYGAAAVQVLRRLGVHDAVRHRLVQGDSVAQAYQFAATGNAELAFVAWSQIAGEGGTVLRGSAWRVPAGLHDPIRQDAVLLNPGRARPAAQALLAYLRSAPARALIAASGYDG